MTTASLKVLVLLAFLSLPDFLKSQSMLRVDLKEGMASEKTASQGFFLYPQPLHLKGTPADLDTMMTWACPLSVSQFLYEQYRYGRIYERFDGEPFTKEAFEDCRMDRKNLTDQEIKYKIYGISGLRKGKKIIAVDANNNGDLSDEIVMEFDTSGLDTAERIEYTRPLPLMTIHYEIFKDGKIQQQQKNVRINPFVILTKSPGKLFEDLKFRMFLYDTFSGDFTLKGKKYHVVVNGFLDETDRNYPYIEITEAPVGENRAEEKLEATHGTILQLKDQWVRIAMVDFDKKQLVLEILENYTPVSVIGSIAPPVHMQDLNGEEFLLESLKGKYVFLHFWGTWCGPCKRDHPALKAVYEQYKNRNIEFVGVALDDTQEIVKNYLKKEKMTWKNLFVSNRDKSATVVDEYDVSMFPTYILIDPIGEIAFKGDLKDLQKLLAEVFN